MLNKLLLITFGANILINIAISEWPAAVAWLAGFLVILDYRNK